MVVRAAIVGVAGYTGEELLKLILKHPMVELITAVGESSAGKKLSHVYPYFYLKRDLVIQKFEDVDFEQIDLAFFCLPHTKSQLLIPLMPDHLKIIDLSADFRLSVALYEQWYGPHLAPELQNEFIYGLSEFNRNKIISATKVACPGCYPTSVLLPLIPVLQNKLADPKKIIIDSKSGISGAGKTPTEANIFCNVSENFIPYKICEHRHTPEIEMTLSNAANTQVSIEFTPNIVPAMRGIVSSIYLSDCATSDTVRETICNYYQNSKFVRWVNYAPNFKSVAYSNYLHFNVYQGRTENTVLIVASIDNLLKGASGQAVQNMNLMYGWEEGLAIE